MVAGIGLVASPSYPNSRVETQSGRNADRKHPIRFPPGMRVLWEGSVFGEAGKGMTATVEFEEGSYLSYSDDLVAIWKNFAAPLASTRKGTLGLDLE